MRGQKPVSARSGAKRPAASAAHGAGRGEVMGARGDSCMVAGHRGGAVARWKRAAVAVAALALPLAASGIAAPPRLGGWWLCRVGHYPGRC